MALTPEQQAQVDIQVAVENLRHTNQLQMQSHHAKLEAIRLAKDVLLENARSKPVDSRDVSANDIKNYAQTLVDYVNG